MQTKHSQDGPNGVMFHPLWTVKATIGNMTQFKPYLSFRSTEQSGPWKLYLQLSVHLQRRVFMGFFW